MMERVAPVAAQMRRCRKSVNSSTDAVQEKKNARMNKRLSERLSSENRGWGFLCVVDGRAEFGICMPSQAGPQLRNGLEKQSELKHTKSLVLPFDRLSADRARQNTGRRDLSCVLAV